jgi:hypothetical protein
MFKRHRHVRRRIVVVFSSSPATKSWRTNILAGWILGCTLAVQREVTHSEQDLTYRLAVWN